MTNKKQKAKKLGKRDLVRIANSPLSHVAIHESGYRKELQTLVAFLMTFFAGFVGALGFIIWLVLFIPAPFIRAYFMKKRAKYKLNHPFSRH